MCRGWHGFSTTGAPCAMQRMGLAEWKRRERAAGLRNRPSSNCHNPHVAMRIFIFVFVKEARADARRESHSCPRGSVRLFCLALRTKDGKIKTRGSGIGPRGPFRGSRWR